MTSIQDSGYPLVFRTRDDVLASPEVAAGAASSLQAEQKRTLPVHGEAPAEIAAKLNAQPVIAAT